MAKTFYIRIQIKSNKVRKPRKSDFFTQNVPSKSTKSVTKNYSKPTKLNITPPSKSNIAHNVEKKQEGLQDNWLNSTGAPRYF